LFLFISESASLVTPATPESLATATPESLATATFTPPPPPPPPSTSSGSSGISKSDPKNDKK